MSTPALWDTVTTFRDPDQTTAYLERSGDLPLNVSITPYFLWSTSRETSFQILGQHSHRFGAMNLHESHGNAVDFLAIMKNPLPRLTRLELDILDRKAVEGPHPFPPLKSLTLGNTTHLQHFQPSNLRKLGVGCDERGFQLPLLELPLLEFLARVPLLEELEFKVAHFYKFEEVREDILPVVLKHLQRVVFRGTRPEFIHSLTSNIIHPRRTKIVLVCYIPDHDFYASYYMFPRGMRLPIPTPPKYIRYQVVHDEDFSESSTCIDLISVDGRHTLIENRRGWPKGYSLKEAKVWIFEELDRPCFRFLQAVDLSSVERLCFERCGPNPAYIEELMGAMDKLETLVVVNADPYVEFMAMQTADPPNVICPLMRRLVVRFDLNIYTQWREMVELMKARAAYGSPLVQVKLTSSFSELLEEPAMSVELLEGVTEVRYDLGRSAVGWEWWKE